MPPAKPTASMSLSTLVTAVARKGGAGASVAQVPLRKTAAPTSATATASSALRAATPRKVFDANGGPGVHTPSCSPLAQKPLLPTSQILLAEIATLSRFAVVGTVMAAKVAVSTVVKSAPPAPPI